jgi:tRNA A-37 threonylcarbamoyl transferase component Bud32
MAEGAYEIEYRAPGGGAYKKFLIAWGFLGLALSLFLAFCLMPFLEHSGVFIQYVYWLALSVILGGAYACVPYIIYVSSSQGNRLHLAKEGLGLPAIGVIPGFHSWRKWSDLESVQLRRHDALAVVERDYLKCKYKNGGETRLYLSGLDEHDLEHLLLSIEAWAPDCQRSDEVLQLQDRLHNTGLGLDTDLGYTKLWEEELSRRFQSTTFVPLVPGAIVGDGRLTISKQIAFGGTAAIYLAQDRFKNAVILKESVLGLSSQTASAIKASEFFEREAELLMKLNHPQIARVLDNFVENDRHYLVITYVPGQNLKALVAKTGPFPEHRVLELADQMANILNYLHTQTPPVMHRDFTPDNLVLKPDGQLVLIDFGAANEFVGTATGTLVGKQCYMPPEQVRGKTCPASDLYAFGCTLYFLLTGEEPEALSTSHPKIKRSGISEATDKLVAELTAVELKDRLKSAQLADLEIDALLSEWKEAPSSGALQNSEMTAN